MRVVLDANVLVSAAIAQGPSYRIVTRWLEHGDLDVVVCQALLAEVEDVLGRPRIQKRIDPESSQRYLATIRKIADVAADPAEIATSWAECVTTPWNCDPSSTTCRLPGAPFRYYNKS